ncbi:MAG: hypothetical protein PHI35_03460, partial [Victivallaceae bacterium]|nr:hypothetical protein [Victivallaceae bacterium]
EKAKWLDDVVNAYLSSGRASDGRVAVLHCPAEHSTEVIGTNYGLNYIVVNGYDADGLKAPVGKNGNFRDPARTSILVDNFGHSCYFYNAVNTKGAYNPSDQMSNRAASFRHSSRTTVGFVDGHAGMRGAQELPCRGSFGATAPAAVGNTVFNLGRVMPDLDTIDSLIP